MDSAEKNLDEWIAYLEGLSEFGTKGMVIDENFMIHVHNLPKEKNVTLGLGNHLALTSPDSLTIEVICDKFNHGQNIIRKVKKRNQRKSIGNL